jgi:hypothetical protein
LSVAGSTAAGTVPIAGASGLGEGAIASRVPGAGLPTDAAAKAAQARAMQSLDATRLEYEKAKQLVAPG